MFMEATGHLVRACCTLLAMFAAMCPATSSSLGIVVFLLEILDFEVSSPCTVPVSCLTGAIVVAEQARLFGSVKRWRSIDLTSLSSLTRLPYYVLFELCVDIKLVILTSVSDPQNVQVV